jgi:hypothetical protein
MLRDHGKGLVAIRNHGKFAKLGFDGLSIFI